MSMAVVVVVVVISERKECEGAVEMERVRMTE